MGRPSTGLALPALLSTPAKYRFRRRGTGLYVGYPLRSIYQPRPDGIGHGVADGVIRNCRCEYRRTENGDGDARRKMFGIGSLGANQDAMVERMREQGIRDEVVLTA